MTNTENKSALRLFARDVLRKLRGKKKGKPAVGDVDTVKSVYDDVFENDENFDILDSSNKPKLKYVLRYTKAVNGKILDAGCGRGSVLRFMLENGVDAFGIELSPVCVEKYLQGLPVANADIVAWSQGDHQYDGCISTDVMEHIPLDQIEATLAALAKLSPSVFLGIANHSSVHEGHELHDHLIIHTGQNYDYELNGIFYEDLGLRQPDVFLEAAGETAAETIGNIIAKSAKVLAEHRPDAVLVLGDTNSCLAVISAKRLKIPTFHMEAGNRCFDMRVPEEINRRIVDHTADINLTYSQIAREYLLREGLDPQRVIVTGSPMREVLAAYGDRIEASNVQEQLGLEKHGYFVVSAHREENIEDPRQFEGLVAILNMLPERFGLPVILSTHPRTRNKIEATGTRACSR